MKINNFISKTFFALGFLLVFFLEANAMRVSYDQQEEDGNDINRHEGIPVVGARRVTSLYMERVTDSEEAPWEECVQSLSSLDGIEEIFFRGDRFSDRMVNLLRDALEGKRLRVFSVTGFENMDDICLDLMSVLSRMPLKRLNFIQSPSFSDDAAISLAGILSTTYGTLEELYLAHTQITTHGLESIAKVIGRKGSALKSMSLAFTPLCTPDDATRQTVAEHMMTIISHSPNMRVLNMREQGGYFNRYLTERLQEAGYTVKQGSQAGFKEGIFFFAPPAEADANPNWIEEIEHLVHD